MSPTKNSRGARPELGELRAKITDLIAHSAVAMVQCAIDRVMEEGQYQAIKYLFEMVGIYPAVAGQAEEGEDTLAKVLLSIWEWRCRKLNRYSASRQAVRLIP